MRHRVTTCSDQLLPTADPNAKRRSRVWPGWHLPGPPPGVIPTIRDWSSVGWGPPVVFPRVQVWWSLAFTCLTPEGFLFCNLCWKRLSLKARLRSYLVTVWTMRCTTNIVIWFFNAAARGVSILRTNNYAPTNGPPSFGVICSQRTASNISTLNINSFSMGWWR